MAAAASLLVSNRVAGTAPSPPPADLQGGEGQPSGRGQANLQVGGRPTFRSGEGQIMTVVFELCANCDLRTALTQCGLSHQEVPMPQTPRTAASPGMHRAAGQPQAGCGKGSREGVSERDRRPGAGSA